MMGALRFRALLCEGPDSRLLADDAEEGPALLAALAVLDEWRRSGDADDVPAKNRHGARRWELRSPVGDTRGFVYLEPTSDAHLHDPGWLIDGGYPAERGWWLAHPDGSTTHVL